MNWQTDFSKFPKDGRTCLISYEENGCYELAWWNDLDEWSGVFIWSNLDDGPQPADGAKFWCEIVPPNIVE